MTYKQKNVNLDGIILPEIRYNKRAFYPLTYVYDKILLKGKQNVSLLKERGYENDLVQLKVDFNFNNGGTHNTYCITIDGLIRLLKSSNIGGLTVDQKKGMNLLLEYLGQDLIDEEPRFLDDFEYESVGTYDEFEKDCIRETLKLDNDLIWQRCKNCGKYYPLHSNFFALNNRDKNYSTLCKNCLISDGKQHFKHPVYEAKTTDEINSIKTLQSEYPFYNKNYDVIGIYNEYLIGGQNSFPEKIKNKEDLILILRYLHSAGCIDKDNLNYEYLIHNHKLKSISSYLKLQEIYKSLYGDHPIQHPWQYKHFKLKSPDFKTAIKLFDTYLKDNNIIIESIYDFNYREHLKNAKLGKKYYNDSALDFIVRFYNNKYPAYRFKTKSINYWKIKENRDRALRFLIEEDMKLEIEKIPLYLTITSIRNIGTTTMYSVLKNYYNSLYDWVNEVYPNVFDPKDFDINYMRNEFDSIDEQTIHDILKENFSNVLYNPKHTENTITLVGKIPDWLVFTETGCIVVEYFGMWVKERGMYNSRTRDYIIRSKDKIEKYKTLEGYKFLYIYPEDLNNNYNGLYEKIEDIKNNKKYMVS